MKFNPNIGLVVVATAALIATTGSANALTIAEEPLFLGGAEARVMLLLSRDHQLYVKAYTDYSDLNGDGTLDVTYTDTIDYYGYFDSNKCYVYSTTDGRFNPRSPSPAATGTNLHECGGTGWSGNFLNWATMTRIDVLRKVLYGGFRRQDDTVTVLERALLPTDVHSFVKVFSPAGGATDVNKFTPSLNQVSISICNTTTDASGLSKSVDTSTKPPKILVAQGAFPLWTSSEQYQCRFDQTGTPASSAAITDHTNLNVRVRVCESDANKEANCTSYTDSSGSKRLKPTGLLQKYSDADANPKLRFGLMTGSYKKNKSGGVLRRNIGALGGTEIDQSTGALMGTGVIDTLNKLRISGYDFTSHAYTGTGISGYSCNSPGILTINDGNCADWGNPISEIYLEALRYFAGKSVSTAFSTSDTDHIAGLSEATWSDPLPSDEWCAQSDIVTISTGLNSFDTDSLTNDLGFDAAALTNQVGVSEGITSGTSVLVGQSGTDNNKQCTAKTVSGLADIKGVCPEVPSLEGGYHIAGLAYGSQTKDLRPSYKASREARWAGTADAEFGPRQPIFNYAVSLAESLPRFEIPVGSGTVTFLPACEARESGKAWRNCSMTDLTVLSLGYSGAKISSGKLRIQWEDSTWGNDYDMDGVEEIEFCVGSACPTAIPSNEIKVTSSVVYANAGHELRFGYTITGTTGDGIYLDISRPGGSNANLLKSPPDARPANWTLPTARTFASGTSTARLLENPLWYAAKYGARPGRWDEDSDGQPDNYFKVTNPAKLEDALSKVLAGAAASSSAASAVAANSTSLRTGGKLYQARFKASNWSGQMLSFDVTTGAEEWDAGALLKARNFSTEPRVVVTHGVSDGVAFQWDALSSSQQTALRTNSSSVVEDVSTGQARLNYLRGSKDNEGTGSGKFRERPDGPLGDIVSSGPWFVGRSGAGYADIDELPLGGAASGDETYSTYLGRIKSRKSLVYVGGNDGMLHAFRACDANETCAAGDLGKEVFAYVPNAVFPNLSRLTDQRYNNNHKYFVDGSPMAGDVMLKIGTAGYKWYTVLIGSMRAGGAGYFALDVTDPDSLTEANAAATVFWELSSAHDADMGLGYFEPVKAATVLRPLQIAKVRVKSSAGADVTKWAAILNNGYNSSTGYASLYVVFIEDGVDGTWSTSTLTPSVAGGAVTKGDFVKIRVPCESVDSVSGKCNDQNGLSTPLPFDSDGDGFVDTVYAGDLKGNLWKFLIGDQAFEANGSRTVSSDPETWRTAFSGKPLFKAAGGAPSLAQPITSAPQIAVHPTSGQLVMVGTGRYLEDGDRNSTTVQSVYGIWDQNTDNSTVSTATAKVARTDLKQRTATTASGKMVVGDNTDNIVWRDASGSGALGWYFDFSVTRERLPSNPVVQDGILFFASLVPSSAKCDFGGVSWLYGLDALQGYTPSFVVFDTNRDGVINSTDTIGGPSTDAIVGGINVLRGFKPGDKGLGVASTTTGRLEKIPLTGIKGLRGRISWRELLQ